MNIKILIVDDEEDVRTSLKHYFTIKGFDVHLANSGDMAIELLQSGIYDIAVTDMAMPGLNGMAVLQWIRCNRPALPCIIITGVGTIENAVEAMHDGAFYYITKPFKTSLLEEKILHAVEDSHERLPTGHFVRDEASKELLISKDQAFSAIFEKLELVANSKASILLTGETGTGKSMLAMKVHFLSDRAGKPFMTIDCGAMPESLLESELFGHVKGAFTGATSHKTGLIKEADGGTVFLDEVGELPPTTQVKLLRLVQDGVFRPLGSNAPIDVDVRFISATSRNLSNELPAGQFREDLYYRLAVVPVHIPPLRERPGDLVPLMQHFIDIYSRLYGKRIATVSPKVISQMKSWPWKGNIRELRNVMERAVLLCPGDHIDYIDLQSHEHASGHHIPVAAGGDVAPLRDQLHKAEAEGVVLALIAAKGNKAKAARMLGVSRRTLYDKIEAYGINLDDILA